MGNLARPLAFSGEYQSIYNLYFWHLHTTKIEFVVEGGNTVNATPSEFTKPSACWVVTAWVEMISAVFNHWISIKKPMMINYVRPILVKLKYNFNDSTFGIEEP
ncbi:MAG: hypothetical protein IPM37_13870 [Hahellaceae bacterium]|nr:hypothetical protein [Hahellaceae bacterium]